MATRLSNALVAQMAAPLLFWMAWCSFGVEEAYAFTCCWDHQFSTDTQEDAA